jgi:signal transduction histidine kinase
LKKAGAMKHEMVSEQHIPNVLIVDDVPANLKILSDILESEGYKVRPVLNGVLALQVAEKAKPDIILLDIMMPDCDGFEVCRRLKENKNLNDVPIIFISALNETNDIVKALNSGGVDYITKPLKAEEVKARVATHLKLYLQSKELHELTVTLEQRVAERTKQLKSKNQELIFHLKEIEQFTFVASHDLQEPLLTLTNFTQLLREDFAGKLGEEGDKYIDFIYQSASRMKTLVRSLVDYSLLGKESVWSKVDFGKLVGEVLSDLSVIIEETNAKITVGELPVLKGYSVELKLMLTNLIGNAIKFHRKEVSPEVTISAEHCITEWVFSVVDNGIGIQEKAKDKIFGLFKRMHNRNEFGGTGIGLAHCRKVVELHGGRILVENNDGAGCTFRFTIPATIHPV